MNDDEKKINLFGPPDERVSIAWDRSKLKPFLQYIICWVHGKGILTYNRREPLKLGRKPIQGIGVCGPCKMEDMNFITKESPDLREMVCENLIGEREAEKKYNGVGYFSIPELIGNGDIGGVHKDGEWFILRVSEEPYQIREAEEHGLHRYKLQGINPIDFMKR